MPWNSTEFPCPYPLIEVDAEKTSIHYIYFFLELLFTFIDFHCRIPCPDPIFKKEQWLLLARLMIIFGSVSFGLLFIQSLYLIANPNCRGKATKRFELYTVSTNSFFIPFFYSLFFFNKKYLNMLLLQVSFMVGGWNPLKTTWCENDFIFSTSKRPTCGAQGIIIHYIIVFLFQNLIS